MYLFNHLKTLISMSTREDTGQYPNEVYLGPNYIENMPPEVLFSILVKLDLNTLVKSRLVSSLLCSVVSDINFWHRYVIYHKLTPLGDKISHKVFCCKTSLFQWYEICLLLLNRPFNRNLIKNGSAEDMTGVPSILEERGAGGTKALKRKYCSELIFKNNLHFFF